MCLALHLQVYYHNPSTGESSWQKPEGFEGNVGSAGAAPVPISSEQIPNTGWSEVTCSDGRKYYYHAGKEVCVSSCNQACNSCHRLAWTDFEYGPLACSVRKPSTVSIQGLYCPVYVVTKPQLVHVSVRISSRSTRQHNQHPEHQSGVYGELRGVRSVIVSPGDILE